MLAVDVNLPLIKIYSYNNSGQIHKFFEDILVFVNLDHILLL